MTPTAYYLPHISNHHDSFIALPSLSLNEVKLLMLNDQNVASQAVKKFTCKKFSWMKFCCLVFLSFNSIIKPAINRSVKYVPNEI